MVVSGDLAAIEQGADRGPILSAPAWALRRERNSCRRRSTLAQLTTAAAKRGCPKLRGRWAHVAGVWNQSSGAGASGRRPSPRGRTVTNAARRVPALGERQAESGRIGLLAFPWDQETLQPTRHEAEQQGGLVADHLDRMRHTSGKSRVGARAHLDTCIADPRD